MSAQKKFKDHYPLDEKNTNGSESEINTLQQKREIEAYLTKIGKLLENDSDLQKKAAHILAEWMKK